MADAGNALPLKGRGGREQRPGRGKEDPFPAAGPHAAQDIAAEHRRRAAAAGGPGVHILLLPVIEQQAAVGVASAQVDSVLPKKIGNDVPAQLPQIPGEDQVIVLGGGVGLPKHRREGVIGRRSHSRPHVVGVLDAQVHNASAGDMGDIGAVSPTGDLSLIADWHEGKSRSLAIGVHMTGLYVGQAIGGFGATVAAAFSWHTTFHWFGILGIAYSVVLLLLLHDKDKDAVNVAPVQQAKPAKGGLFQGLSVVLSTWAFWVILFYFAVPSLPGWATKNWLPTLFAENLGIPMSQAGPMSTITIAVSSLHGVLFGGVLSDKWVQKNIRGRVYTSAIGLGMTIPALFLLGFGHSLVAIVGAGLLFGIGYGMFDANNMPILCQIISAKYRATAYGIMNMVGVFAGAMVTQVMGKCSDGGNLGFAFAVLGIVVIAALTLQLVCLKPKTDNLE